MWHVYAFISFISWRKKRKRVLKRIMARLEVRKEKARRESH